MTDSASFKIAIDIAEAAAQMNRELEASARDNGFESTGWAKAEIQALAIADEIRKAMERGGAK